METIPVIIAIVGYFIVRCILLVLQEAKLSKMIDEKIDVFFEKERNVIHDLSSAEEESANEALNISLIERYGYDTVAMTESLYNRYSEVFVGVDKELQRQFPISPELLQYSKVTKKIESLVQERLALSMLSHEILLISCTFDVGIIDVLTILKEKYNLTNCLIVPLHIAVITEVDHRNNTAGKKWREAISVSEIILSIARNKANENWGMCSELDTEFNRRLEKGSVNSQTFRSLLSLSSQIDMIVSIQNSISKDDQKVNDKHLSELITTVNEYNERYKRYVYSSQGNV